MATQNPEIIIWKPAGDNRPPVGVVESGWLPGEQPPAEYENFMSNYYGTAIEFFILNGNPSHSTAYPYQDGAVIKSGSGLFISLQVNQNVVPVEGGNDIWAEFYSSNNLVPWSKISGKPTTYPPTRSSSTVEGGLKSRLSGTTLYLTNDGSDA